MNSIFKYIAIINLAICQQYDPTTGKLLEQKQYDPTTGKEIQNKPAGTRVSITLLSGDKITGLLKAQDSKEIIIESPLLGMKIILRKNIKKINVSGAPVKARRAISSEGFIKKDNLKSIFKQDPTLENIAYWAQKEARDRNKRINNLAIGTGACVTGWGLPIMALAINSGITASKPSSTYYVNLEAINRDLYEKKYIKEVKRIQYIEGFTPTAVLGLGFLVIIVIEIFSII